MLTSFIKSWLFIVFLPLLNQQAFSQKLNFVRLNAKQIDSVEMRNTAEKHFYNYTIGVSETYFPGRKKYWLLQPIIYRKRLGDFLLETSYHLSKNDSTLRLIEYWWRDTTYSHEFPDSILSDIDAQVEASVHAIKNIYPETEKRGEVTTWANDLIHIEKFPVAEGWRVLVSWK